MDVAKRKQMEVFFNPGSVAVIGASERPPAWGWIIMQGLLHWKYGGRIYPVNKRGGSIFGIKAYPSILDVPGKVDLALLTVPAEIIRETVEACGRKGVKGVVIIAAGFSEAVEGGRVKEVELTELARKRGMQLLGPNVSGSFNLNKGFNASAAPAAFLLPAPISAVCQGSYFLYDLLVGAYFRNMGLGQFVQTGNECDLEVTDFLKYFGEDPETKVILMYLETLRNVDRFIRVAGQVAKKKPVIVQKVGRTPGGSRAAQSHTGAMAGRDDLYRALFRKLNMVESPAVERLIPLGHAFLRLPDVTGKRIAVVTMGGSWGVALTDQLEERGLEVPELSPSLQALLRELGLPIRSSTRNPIDIGAGGSIAFEAEKVAQIVRKVTASGEVDALVLHGFGRLAEAQGLDSESRPMIMEQEKGVIRACVREAEHTDKPILIGMAVHASESDVVRDLADEGLLILHSLGEIADVLSLKYRHYRQR